MEPLERQELQLSLPAAEWGAWHAELNGKVRGGVISEGTGNRRWAVGVGTLPQAGRYRITYRVDTIDAHFSWNMYLGVGSLSADIVGQSHTASPSGWYGWWSYSNGDETALAADGAQVQGGIRQKTKASSVVVLVVDQDASTISITCDGAHVGVISNVAHKDLTPAATVFGQGSTLALVSVVPEA